MRWKKVHLLYTEFYQRVEAQPCAMVEIQLYIWLANKLFEVPIRCFWWMYKIVIFWQPIPCIHISKASLQ